MADIDYEFISNPKKKAYRDIIYNVICPNNGCIYNDIETFLVNTNALKCLLSMYDIKHNTQIINSLRKNLEKSSRSFGKYRAADYILSKGKQSILNGLEILEYIDVRTFNVNEKELMSAIPSWSNKPLDVDDLISKANELDKHFTDEWALSRGHDITEILTEYLKVTASNQNIQRNHVEKYLTMACDLAEYKSAPMGRALMEFDSFNICESRDCIKFCVNPN